MINNKSLCVLQTTQIHYREEFTNPKTGKFFKKGETIKRPMFAKTLKQIGENGTSDIFYYGSLGEKIVKEIQSLKGIITMEDLKSYKYYQIFHSLKSSFSDRLLQQVKNNCCTEQEIGQCLHRKTYRL